MHTVSMIVAESQSHWLPWFHAWQGKHDQLVVVAQHEDEPYGELGERVMHRIRQLRGDGARIQRVALVGNDRWNREDVMSRSSMMRWLAGMVGGAPGQARIVLDPSNTTHPRAKWGLQALASATTEHVPATATHISVREPPRQAA